MSNVAEEYGSWQKETPKLGWWVDSLRESVWIPWEDGKTWGSWSSLLERCFFKNLSRVHGFSSSYEGESVCTNFMESVPQSGLEHTTVWLILAEWRNKGSKCWSAAGESASHREAGSPQPSVTALWRAITTLLIHSLFFFLSPQSTGAPKSVLPESAG